MATASPPSGLLRFVPALDALRTYSLAAARADFVAGLTVAAVAVPQAMAYGLSAGVPAEHGLYTAIVMTTVGALLDSSRQLINGPTNAISIAVLSALAPFPEEEKLAGAVFLALLIGCFQTLITLARLGDLTRYISHSVVVGFTFGASALLVLDQWKHLLGLRAMGDPHDHFLVRLFRTLTEGGPIHTPTAAIGIGTIALLVAVRWVKSKLGSTLFPDLLLVVVVMSAVTGLLGLDGQGVKVVGEIPAKLPGFVLPHLSWRFVTELSDSALAIALLGLLEAIAMAKGIAAQTGQKLDLNQQCLSEGLANVSGSFFQCIPGSGSLTRSAINQQAGAATQWSGVWSAAAVALIVLFFAPYARFIPKAALAGMLVVASSRMVDWKGLRYHTRATRFDLAIVAATAFSAVFISIEFCILIGIVLSIALTVPRVGAATLTEFVVHPNGQVDERDEEHEVPCSQMLIFGVEGELFFGSAASLEAHFGEMLRRVREARPRVLVLRVKRLRNPDAVGLHALGDFLDAVQGLGVTVLLAGLRADLRDGLTATGVTARLRPDQLFAERTKKGSSTLDAIQSAYALLGDERCAACPRAPGTPSPRLHHAVR
jgi:SulP family sulfate permease